MFIRRIQLFLSFLLYRPSTQNGNLTITGGGVITVGQNVKIEYVTNSEWFLCHYFRYSSTDCPQNGIETEFCTYLNKNGQGLVVNCFPNSLQNHLEYIGNSSTECNIVIRNVTMDDNTVWGIKLSTDTDPMKFRLKVTEIFGQIPVGDPTKAAVRLLFAVYLFIATGCAISLVVIYTRWRNYQTKTKQGITSSSVLWIKNKNDATAMKDRKHNKRNVKSLRVTVMESYV